MDTITPVVEIETGKLISKNQKPGDGPYGDGNIMIVTRTDLKKLQTKAMLRLYNELNGSTIKKFSSREAGESQVMKFCNPHSKNMAPKPKAAATPKPKAAATSKPKAAAKKKAATKKSASPKQAAKKSAPAKSKDVSGALPKVHHRVECNGKEYKSIVAAFRELRLPISKVGAFRGLLNRSDDGKLSFEHEGKSYMFTHIT